MGDSKKAQTIKIRPATVQDAHVAAKLLHASFPGFSSYGPGLNNDERARTIYEAIFRFPKQRFSVVFHDIAEIKGAKAGTIVHFSSKQRSKANRNLGLLLLRWYGTKGKMIIIRRLFPMIFLEEGKAKDHIISNIAVLSRFQRQGVGKRLVKAVEKQARADGDKRMVVMIPILNKTARSFFESLGYKVKAVVLESNRRVKMFGPGYHRMVKKL